MAEKCQKHGINVILIGGAFGSANKNYVPPPDSNPRQKVKKAKKSKNFVKSPYSPLMIFLRLEK
jgi:hypothetical protein